MAKVCVLGLGYIGLPTSALMAVKGHEVIGVDINKDIVNSVNTGKCHIVEPGLDALVEQAVGSGSLIATTKPEKSDVFLIIVPTPFNEEDKSPDMSYVRKAAKSLAPLLEEGNLVVLESTSEVGSTRKHVMEVILTERPELKDKVSFAFCPERAIPGDTLRELLENDRTVGGVDKVSAEKVAEFYKTFIMGDILQTTADTAELVKLVENSFRDTNIAFANELSLVCDKLEIDVWETIKLANRHPRVNIMQPGPGVGGHCIAVDPWFIVNAAPEQARLIKTAREVNDNKPYWVVNKVAEAVNTLKNDKNIAKPTILLLGLAFKPNVDDLRESPSIKVAKMIKQVEMLKQANIIACEPFVNEVDGFNLVSAEDGLQAADIVVMLTDHDEFKAIPKERFAGKILIDTRGTFAEVNQKSCTCNCAGKSFDSSLKNNNTKKKQGLCSRIFSRNRN